MADCAALISPRSMQSRGEPWVVDHELRATLNEVALQETEQAGGKIDFLGRAGHLTRRSPFRRVQRRVDRRVVTTQQAGAGEMRDAVYLHRPSRAVDEAPAGVERNGQVTEHDGLSAAGGEGVVTDVLAVVRGGDGVGRLQGVAR